MLRFTLILLFVPAILFSQQGLYPLNHEFNIEINKQLNLSKVFVHSGLKPLIFSQVQPVVYVDSIIYPANRDSSFLSKRKHTRFWRKLRTEDFIIIDSKPLHLAINPLLNLEYGKLKSSDSTYSVNTRGIELKGNIGKKFSFYSAFYENQAFYVTYITELINKTQVVPGQGSVKVFKKNGNDFSMVTGYFSYSPTKAVNIQAGHGKFFIGEGYRSLLLSDNSYNFPFLKATIAFKKWQYSSIFTELQDFKQKYYYYHYKKNGTFNFLSYHPISQVEIGLFEGIVWNTSDDSTYIRKFPVSFFIPVPLIRPLISPSLLDKNNVLSGFTIKIDLIDFIQLYGQLAINSRRGSLSSKTGYQLGFKCFDLFFSHLNKQNLYFQTEYNQTQPYMFSGSLPYQSYSHYNQALAHPLGAGFKEMVGILNYKFRDFFIHAKYTYAITSRDTANSNFGADIFIPLSKLNSFGNTIGQGLRTTISHKTIQAGFLINPNTNLQLLCGVDIRKYKNTLMEKISNFYYLGIRTSLTNFYFDF
jgi:hypothetical protein